MPSEIPVFDSMAAFVDALGCTPGPIEGASSRRSIKEIAYALGFSEATHFWRFFKRETGLTPTAFRRRGAGRVAT